MRVCSFASALPINILVTASKSIHLTISTSHEWKFIFWLHHAAECATATQLEQIALERGTWKKGYECKRIWHQTSCHHTKIKEPRKHWMQSSSVDWVLLYKDPGDSIEKLASLYYLPHLAQHGISWPNLRKDYDPNPLRFFLLRFYVIMRVHFLFLQRNNGYSTPRTFRNAVSNCIFPVLLHKGKHSKQVLSKKHVLDIA